MKSHSDELCQTAMYTLQSFHTPSIAVLLLIVPEKQFKQLNLQNGLIKHETEVKFI